MGDRQSGKVDRLIDYFMQKIMGVIDDEDWNEADGWVIKFTITGKEPRIFLIDQGQVVSGSEQDSYTGQVEMSEDTFLDLVTAVMEGNAERVFAEKYGRDHIRYTGDQWIADSERFRRILRRVKI